MDNFDAKNFNEEDYIKMLDMLYEYTHKKDFYVICNSEEIKKQLEEVGKRLDISSNYHIIVDTMISEQENRIYVLPMNTLEKPIKFIIERDDINYDIL